MLAGERVGVTAHFALHRCVLDGARRELIPGPATAQTKACLFAHDAVWLGAMVPKRWAKRAVTRNTIKRQIYNVSIQFESMLPVAAHVVRLRSAFDRTLFLSASSEALKHALRKELAQLFSRATRGAMPGPSPGLPRC